MTDSPTATPAPPSETRIAEDLINELIELLRKVIENSGTGRTAQQIQELIIELGAVTSEVKKLNKTLEAWDPQGTELRGLGDKIDEQSELIGEIGEKVSRMYPAIFEPDARGG